MIVLVISVIVFFFKQKTAYEMRISDWSSDVCSSDLLQSVTIRRDVLIRSQITLATEPFSDTRHAKIHIPLLDQSSGRDGFECFMGCLALVLQIGLGQSSILLILRSKTVKPLD